jgi:hypothetical protein
MGTMLMVRRTDIPRLDERARTHDNGMPIMLAINAALTEV